MTTLATARLLLRPFAEADLDAYAALLADLEVVRHLGGVPLSRADAWRHMAMLVGHWTLRGYGMWAVEERARPGRLVGRLGLHRPEGWPGVEVGWALAPAVWGRGYATEGARAAVAHAFGALDLSHVVSLIAPENARSIAVAERLGARAVGTWPHAGREQLLYRLDRAA